MRTQTLLSALVLPLLSLAAPVADVAAVTKTYIGYTSFGIDPLQLQSSSGNQQVTNVGYDPANAWYDDGYLSVSFPATTDKQYVVYTYGHKFKPNIPLTITIMAKSPTNTGNCYVTVGLQDPTGTTIGETNGAVVGLKYSRFSLQLNAPSTTGKSAAFFYVSCTGGTAETVYLDEFSVTTP